MTAPLRAIYAVKCRQCGAEPHDGCVTPTGGPRDAHVKRTVDGRDAAERIIDAAAALCSADDEVRNVKDVQLDDVVRRDAALHDMRRALGFECGCDPGTCPGPILAVPS